MRISSKVDPELDTRFLAVVQDRHYDPMYRIFKSRERAISWALKTFREYVASPRKIKVVASSEFEWQALYGEEGDYALVEKVAINEED